MLGHCFHFYYIVELVYVDIFIGLYYCLCIILISRLCHQSPISLIVPSPQSGQRQTELIKNIPKETLMGSHHPITPYGEMTQTNPGDQFQAVLKHANRKTQQQKSKMMTFP